MSRRGILVWFSIVVFMLCGCDPLTRYQIATTIFDGVPKMPPADQYCREYHERATAEELEAAKKKELAAQKEAESVHPPYEEKRCNDCHDKNSDSGFVVAKENLCAVCHPNLLVKAAYLHGPAAIGACLKCHEPHSAKNSNLLVSSKKDICAICHNEKRLTGALHSSVSAKGMICTDCHDPHGGDTPFFTK